jgi:hypothetical protein
MILPAHVCPEESREIILKHIYQIDLKDLQNPQRTYLALYKSKRKTSNDTLHKFEVLATYGRVYRDSSVPFIIHCMPGIFPVKIKEIPTKELPLYLNPNWNLTSNFTKLLKKIKQKDIA